MEQRFGKRLRRDNRQRRPPTQRAEPLEWRCTTGQDGKCVPEGNTPRLTKGGPLPKRNTIDFPLSPTEGDPARLDLAHTLGEHSTLHLLVDRTQRVA